MKAQQLLPDEINQGEFNGTLVRKGTVGAFLINAKLWLDASATPAQRQEAEQDILEALPALHALGLFEVCTVRDSALHQLMTTK